MAPYEALVADVFASWDAIKWRSVVIGGHHASLPDAREALAEDTLGGGFVRGHGSGAWVGGGALVGRSVLKAKGD